jgi:hypothetical protein
MDRPKHRRLILLGVVLLVGGALLLFGRQWTPTTTSSTPSAPTTQVDRPSEPPSPEVEPARGEAAALDVAKRSAPAPPAATGFRGRVVDAVTSESVQAFEVQLTRIRREQHTEDPSISRRFKSSTGRFVWADVAAGRWRASVAAPGYQQFNLDELEIVADQATREFVMPLRRGFAVRGRVFELSTGAAIPDAYVGFRQAGAPDSDLRRTSRAKSQDDGSFTLDGVPAGDVVLSVGAQGHAYRELGVVVDEKTPPQEIALSPGGTIAGIVTTAAGAPVTGRVLLRGWIGYMGETNEAGRFSYAHLVAGKYRVTADTAAGSASQDIQLGRDEIREDIVLVVGGGRSVRGVVRGLRPEQLSQTHLMLRPASEQGSFSTQPDEQGAYALKGVPPGRAVISIFGPGRQFDKPVEVPADQDVTLDLIFPAGARLSGRVTQGGKPVVGKSVWMRPVEDRFDTLYQAFTSADGQYEIEGLPSGDYRLRADEDISRVVSIAADTVLNIDIPSAQLAGRILEDGGSVPIVGANVYVRGSDAATARVRADKQTDDFGQFRVTGIESGDIVLLVYKTGYEMYREKIAYSSPIPNKTITLRKSTGVEVRVKPGSRRFPIGFTITQYIPGNDSEIDLWMPLDREGICHVPSALAGTTMHIGRFSGKPIVIEDWDGQSFELQ